MNVNIKHIYLHIGVPKTASSSIQSTLHLKKNDIHLKRIGYLYPINWELNHSCPIGSAFCENPQEYWVNILKGLSAEEIRAYNNRNLFFLESEIKKTTAECLIISGEGICNLNKENIIELKNYLTSITKPDVKMSIIVYVRNPLKRAISDIQQTIKNQHTENIAIIHIKNQIQSFFKDRIEKFIDIFGKTNIHLYEFEKAVKHRFGPVGHFLSAIDLEEKDIEKFKFKKINQSISQISADIISYINLKKPRLINGKLNPDRHSGDYQCLFKISGKRFDISNREKEEIYENSISDAIWLKKQFNVDYTHKPLLEKEKEDDVFNKKTCKEVEQAYLKASPVIRELIYRYFLEEVEETKISRSNKNALLKAFKKIEREKGKDRLSFVNRIKEIKHYYIIKTSGLFDKNYYIDNLQDGQKIKSNPILHYLRSGASQGQDPSKEFNTAFYLQQHRDVFFSGMNPLVHFILYGKEEGRQTRSNMTRIDFLIVSDNKNMLNLVYENLKWHPLIYMDQKNAERTLSGPQEDMSYKIADNIMDHQNGPKNVDHKIAGNLLLEKDLQKTIKEIYDYNPDMKIVLIQNIPDKHIDKQVEGKSNYEDAPSDGLEKRFSETFKDVLFLPVTDMDGVKEKEMFNKIFQFLRIEPWMPV